MMISEFEIAKLQLAAGDVLVVRCSRPVPAETAERIKRDYIGPVLPAGVKCLVIDAGVDLSVLTQAEIARRAAA